MKKLTFRVYEPGKHVKGWYKVPVVCARCAFRSYNRCPHSIGFHRTKYKRIARPGRLFRDEEGTNLSYGDLILTGRMWLLWRVSKPHRHRTAA